jgi:hypothetical protein
MLHAGVEVLRADVKSPHLQGAGNWLVRQLNDEPKLVYKVGFLERKEILQLEKCSRAWKLETRCWKPL